MRRLYAAGEGARSPSSTTTKGRFSRPSVLVRVVHVAARHGDAERAERVLDPDRVAVRGEDVRQALVHLRRLVGTAADQDDALLAQARLDGRPVDHARPYDLLGPPLAQLRVRVVRAGLARVALGRDRELAVPHRAREHRLATHAAGRL